MVLTRQHHLAHSSPAQVRSNTSAHSQHLRRRTIARTDTAIVKIKSMSQTSNGPSIPAGAVIVLCLLGAGALLLCCYALFRHFYESDPTPSPTNNINPDDGMTQAQYMRIVRLRNQEALQAKYGWQNRYPMERYHSSGMMTQSSVMSV